MSALTFGGSELSYERLGSGSPIVLIHGLGTSKVIWRELQEHLASQFEIVTYDLRGSGLSHEDSKEEMSLERLSSDLRRLVQALGLDRPSLLGHSLGASIALKYTLCWPDDVQTLVLMGADANLSNLGPRMRQVVKLIEQHGLEGWVEDYWSKNPPFSEKSIKRSPEVVEHYRAMVLANDPDNYMRTCLAIATAEDLTSQLGAVRQPALVISGAADDRTLPGAGRELAARLGDAELIEFAEVGHTIPTEVPGLAAEAIVEFLVRNSGRSQAQTLDAAEEE